MRTHSGLIDSTTASSTSRSASSRKVQWVRPSGGAPHASAIRWASWTPSSLRYWRPVGFFRSRAAGNPSSTNAWRTRYTVEVPHSTASAIWPSSQPGPSAPASALSKMRAWSSTDAARFPVRIRSSSSVRSLAVRRTIYFGSGMVGFRVRGILTGKPRRGLKSIQVGRSTSSTFSIEMIGMATNQSRS